MKKNYFFKFIIFTVIAAFVTVTSCKDYDDDINRLDGDISSIKTDYASKLDALKTELNSAIDAKVKTVSDEVTALKTKVATLEANSATKQDIEAAKAEILAKVVALEAFNTFKAKTEADITELKNDLANAATKEQLDGVQTALTAELGTVKGQIDAMGLRVTNLEENYATLLAKHDTDVADLIAKIADAKSTLGLRIDNAEALIAAAEGRITDLDSELKGLLEDQLEKINTNINDIKVLNENLTKTEEELSGEIDKLNSDIERVTNNLEDLTSRVSTLENNIKDLESKLGERLLSVTESVNSMVTYVQLLDKDELKFSSVIVQSNLFLIDHISGENATNAISFTEGDQEQTEDYFFIRVSPTNAELKKEMISLQNSLGETLDNIEVVNVEHYEKLYTEELRSTNNNGSGLWKVSVKLKNYDKKTFDSKSKKDGLHILYAVALNSRASNSETTLEERKVTSDYALKLNWDDFSPAGTLNYFVDNKPVEDIKNRNIYSEKIWKDEDKPAVKGTDNNTTSGDNRSDKKSYPAVQGKAIKISLSADKDKVEIPTNIRAMYITLDYEKNAFESAPSEWNAWNSYNYGGDFGVVVEGTEAEIIINSDKAIKDEIGFRVFAVNKDGTLVDPDGKAFYVVLGTDGTNWNSIDTQVEASEAFKGTTTKSKDAPVSLSALSDAKTFEWTTDKIGSDDKVFHVEYYGAENNIIFSTNGGNLSSADFSKVTKIKTVAANDDWTEYEDNKVYSGTLTIKNSTGHVLATHTVTFKKTLPNTVPAGFSPKTGQIVNGIYNSYLIPVKTDGTPSWEYSSADLGQMKLTEVFNFGENEAEKYVFTFAQSKKDGDKTVDLVVKGNESLKIDKNFIDNKTEHNTTVSYNYGKISSKKVDGKFIDYTVKTIEDFKTIYSNIYNKSTYTWTWKSGAKKDLTYGVNSDLKADEYIEGKSSKDSRYNALLSEPYGNSLQIQNAVLISKENGQEGEYFDVIITDNHITGFKATTTSENTNPNVPVPSTLRIKAKDMYGQEVVIELDMVVNKR